MSMDAMTWADALIAASSTADSKRLASDAPPGAGSALFQRLAVAVGASPTEALAVARKARFLPPADRPWQLRVRAVEHRLTGNWSASAKAFLAAGEACSDPTQGLIFSIGAIDSLARAGKQRSATTLGQRIAKGLRQAGEHGHAGRALLNFGNALLWGDRHREAEPIYQQALEALEGTDFRAEFAAAKVGLSTAAIFVRSPRECLRLAEEAEADLEALGLTAYAVQARINRGHALLRMGQPDRAILVFAAIREEVPVDSFEFARVGQYLGDAYLWLELETEAEAAYRSALDAPGIRQIHLSAANCRLGLAEVALRREQSERALALFREARRDYKAHGNESFVLMAELGVLKARVALGESPTAKTFQPLVIGLERKKLWQPVAETLILWARVAPLDQAIALARRAGRIIQSRGMLNLAWMPSAVLAERRGERRDFRELIRHILLRRAGLTSEVARANVTAQAQLLIRRFLSELLATGRAKDRDEARQLILSLRMAALIDEIQSSKAAFSDGDRAFLDELRQALADTDPGTEPGGPTRQVGLGRRLDPQLQRRFFEVVGLGGTATSKSHQPTSAESVFTFLPTGSAWIEPNSVRLAPMGAREVQDVLGWIQFEVSAALQGQTSDPNAVIQDAMQLRRGMQVEHLAQGRTLQPLAVEDIALQIPWSILLDPVEPVIELCPGQSRDLSRFSLTSDANVAIWYHQREELPHIQREVDSIVRQFPMARVFERLSEVQRHASETQWDLVHVAAHGTFHPENPMFSTIQLRDGFLTAWEVSRMGMSTRLAVLGSCDSAQLSQGRTMEPQGWARAFLANQVEAFLGSIWPLDDFVAASIFDRFYRKLGEGAELAVALSEARQAIRRDFPHPAFWAPLTLFAGYQA